MSLGVVLGEESAKRFVTKQGSMNHDYIGLFIEFLKKNDLEPHDVSVIVADDTARYYRVCGDRAGQKRGSYCLLIRGDAVVGWCHDHRIGQTYSYDRKMSSKWTQEQKEAFKQDMAAIRRQREDKDVERQEAAAKEAVEIWRSASAIDEGDHPYLEKKSIAGQFVRVKDGKLIIPCYAENKMWGIQTIDGDGAKMFQLGARKRGCYAALATKDDDKSIIVITEGYATAETIRMATGFICVAAFDCGNLEPVAVAMREKYPEARIIIAADNDQWRFDRKKKPKDVVADEVAGDDPRWMGWREAGILENIGVMKGRAAAVACKGHMVFPDIDLMTEGKPSDWNDYAAIHGIDAVGEIFDNLVSTAMYKHGALDGRVDGLPAGDILADSSSVPSTQPSDSDWRDGLICDGKGEVLKSSLKNNILMLSHHDRYKNIFRYNEFAHQVYVCQCPPWSNDTKFEVHRLGENDITECAAALEDIGLTPEISRVHRAIAVASYYNRFHPAREYFDSLQWDGVKRLDTWLSKYMGAVEDDPAYLAFIGAKWMTAAVNRIYEPGCKFDHMVVADGAQGIGKSTGFKVLATFGDDVEESYFTDSITLADIQNKDTIQKIQGSIIIELAELAGFSKKDDDEIKRWITLQADDTRLPYDRTLTKFKRQFVLSATTNSNDYLKDATGNRRYWPFTSSSVDLEGLRDVKKQLWAEAVHNYKNGMYIGPTAEEMKMAATAQNRRLSVDPWEDDVLKVIGDYGSKKLLEGFKVDDLMRDMGFSLKDRDMRARRRVSNILQQNGYKNAVRRIGGKSHRVWLTSPNTAAPTKVSFFDNSDAEEIKF